MSRIKSRKGNRADNSWMQLDEQATPFLAPDSDENAMSVATELRDRMVQIEQPALAPYTATAAYATLAKQGVASTPARPATAGPCPPTPPLA